MMFSLSFVGGPISNIHIHIGPPGPYPLPDLDRGIPYPLPDLDRGVHIRDRIWTGGSISATGFGPGGPYPLPDLDWGAQI